MLLRIADSGVGFDRELAERLFQPFVQGKQEIDRINGRASLGLAISRKLAELQSGSLTAEKELKVTRHGNIAWTTVPMHFSAKMKDGKTIDTPVRYTGIWEKKGKTWVLVHEHLSAPLGG